MTGEENLPELPEGWAWTRVGELANKIHYGYTAKATTDKIGPKMLRITDIQNNMVNWESVPFCSIDENDIDKYILKERDLVFARTGATVGKSFLIKGRIPKSVFASYLIRVIFSGDIDPKYVYNFFQSNDYWLQISEGQLGIGQPNVNATILSQLTFPLPPLPEQHRIVAKIEELFTRLDAGVSALTTLKTQLKRYRQAVLKSAMEGKLTAKWREERNISIMNDWNNLSMKDILVDIKYGTSKKCGYDDTLTPVLRIPNVANRTIDTNDMKYTSLEPKDFDKLRLKSGDILIIRSNGSLNLVGRSALVTKKVENYCYAGYLIRLRINYQKADSKFINYLIHSHLMRLQIEKKAKSTSGVNNINSKEISALRINLPLLSEQIEIVKMIEEKFSMIDDTITIISQSLTRAERLRQSILKRAFEGKLIPQDPNDEPASRLLERIREEKGKVGSRSKRKRRRGK